MGFFRWNYIVPRLVLLFVLLCASEVGVGLLAKWSLESAGSQAVGARVDVASSSASLINTHVALTGVKVADPNSPMTNLVEAELIDINFDPAALLRKKAVANHGVIRGLRFGGERDESGALAEESKTGDGPAAPAWLGDAASEGLDQWLANVESRLTADLVQDLQAPVVAEELRREWPQRAQHLQASADELQARITALQETVRVAQKNPLRSLEVLRQTPAEVADLVQDITALRGEIAQLPQQAATDRQRVAAARRHDEAKIRERLDIENLDAERLTAALLGEQLSGPVSGLIDTIRWVRKLAPAGEATPTQPARGIDVLFAGNRPLPDVLIRKLDVAGVATVAGRAVEINGRISDFTTQPNLHGEPMTFSLAAASGLPFEITGTIDRTSAKAKDTLIANCPTFPIAAVQLGSNGLQLETAPSTASIRLDVALDDDTMNGTLRLVQDEVSLNTKTDSLDNVLASSIADDVSQAVSRVLNVTTTVTLSGSLESPTYSLESTLGPIVAEAMQTVVRQALSDQADGLIAKSHQRADAELAELEASIATVSAKLSEQLSTQTGLLEQFSGVLAQRSLGGQGPRGLGSLLKSPLR